MARVKQDGNRSLDFVEFEAFIGSAFDVDAQATESRTAGSSSDSRCARLGLCSTLLLPVVCTASYNSCMYHSLT